MKPAILVWTSGIKKWLGLTDVLISGRRLPIIFFIVTFSANLSFARRRQPKVTLSHTLDDASVNIRRHLRANVAARWREACRPAGVKYVVDCEH
jgi:hypothetical protein